MDDLRLYRVALSASEITDLYGSGNGDFHLISSVAESSALVPGKFSKSLALEPNEYVTADGGKLPLSTELTLSLWTKIREDDFGVIASAGQFRLEYHDDNTIRGYVRIGNTKLILQKRLFVK